MPISSQPTVEYVERLIDETKRIYAATQERLERLLRSPIVTAFQQYRATELLRQIKQARIALDAQAVSMAERAIPVVYQQGTDIAARQLAAMNMTPASSMGARLATGAVQALTESIITDLVTANQTIESTLRRAVRATKQSVLREDAISRTLAEGIAAGDTRRAVSKRIEQQLEDALNGGKWVQAGKRRYTPADYAELVTRTRTREAVTEGSINAGLAAGCDLVQISVHDGACPICLQYQGRVYSVNGNSIDFPRLNERPPYHPRCRHVAVPITAKHLKRRNEFDRLRTISNSAEPIDNLGEYSRLVRG